MRQILFLILLALAGVAHAFDTAYSPAKHAVTVAIQCDDRVDSQFVYIALDHGIKISFAPYRDGAGQIIDIDSTDFNNSGTATKGEYNEWLNYWARDRGMPMATHAQHHSPTVLATYGKAGLDSVFRFESQFVRRTAGISGLPLGHVWTGHINSPQTRAIAKEYGYSYTRGNLPKDLYLGNGGWLNERGGYPFPPMCMTHKIVVPSISMYRLTEPMAGDSLYQTSTVSDTTHLWRGTLNFLNTMAEHNGFGVLNIHPAWGIPHSETVADTMVTTWVTIPNTYADTADSIRFNTRKGVTGRNDVSAYQLDYILAAMDWWDDSCLAVDGVRRLCVADIDELIQDPAANWRTDNSSDWTAVSDWYSGASAGSIDEDYWTSSTGLYAKDPVLNTSRVVYIDGTGDVKAGNGTAQYPLPQGAITHVFNSKAIYTGHAAGDSLILPRPLWRTANVDVDFAGLKILPATVNTAAILMDSTSSNVYLHNISLRNFALDGRATTASTPYMMQIGSGGGTVDSLRATNITLKGATFMNGELPLYVYNGRDVVIDSCFFRPGSGAITDNGATWALTVGQYNKNTLIRNSLFDMADCGGGSGDASGSGVSGAIQLAAHGVDSLRIVNNTFSLGNAADTDDYQAALRTPATNSSLKLRFAGNYISSAGVGTNAAKVWLNTTGYAALTLAQLADTTALYQSGVYQAAHNFLASGYGIGGFYYLADPSDTTRFGGYTGPGSVQTGSWASIGPSQYGYSPRIGLNPAASSGQAQGFADKNLYQMAALYTTGVLAACDSLDSSTWVPVQAPTTTAGEAQLQITLDQYNDLPLATRQKMKLTTVY